MGCDSPQDTTTSTASSREVAPPPSSSWARCRHAPGHDACDRALSYRPRTATPQAAGTPRDSWPARPKAVQTSDTRQEAKEPRASIVSQASGTGKDKPSPDHWTRNPTDTGNETSPCGSSAPFQGRGSTAENQCYQGRGNSLHQGHQRHASLHSHQDAVW